MVRVFLSVCLLLCAGAGWAEQSCVWESDSDPNWQVKRGLDSMAGASYLDQQQVKEEGECKELCCGREDCQLALIGYPADGQPLCYLVNCVKDGKDVCVLSESSQFRVYKKSTRIQSRSASSFNTTECRLQKLVGLCRASIPRFFYDVTSQTCTQFTYGGCGGNNNNFETQKDCETFCSGVTGEVIVDTQVFPKRRMVEPLKNEDVSPKATLPKMTSEEFAEKCQADPKVGLCKASMPRFYYKSGTCKQFIYGGCRGNKNNYESEEECMKTCTVTIVDSKKEDSKEDITDYKEACTASPETGRCRGYFQKFYFDPSTQSCKSFVYGGCGGNKNQHNTEEECMSKCSGKDGKYDEHGHSHSRDRWTPAFFLVATLAIMSIVLLVGLLLISSRRTRQQLTFTLDDKQELLPEEYLPAEELPKPVVQ